MKISDAETELLDQPDLPSVGAGETPMIVAWRFEAGDAINRPVFGQ